MQAPQALQILTLKPLHLRIWTPNHWEMLANLTLRGLGLCDLCPSFIAEGLWFTTVNKWRWWTKASLNSSSVLVSRSFWRKVMSENIVAKVRPTSVAVLVLFWRGKKEKCEKFKTISFHCRNTKWNICPTRHHLPRLQDLSQVWIKLSMHFIPYSLFRAAKTK